ncbi:Ephrin-A2 ELF-1 EPH-related receptor tyrosine kinase ligand 6 [Channa argus]|uniref:Ephrin-A2 ELF-1 EPH-related receptor tyrosine kinase ligand 6 n=1 Tax=Channa argus TaxID=215402 RepID=A0A6G1QES5_CHAAH|nr:Ephrin-A2 ELF-1 EPH-related receptor tyrosine kinase ligand 6 [Channa argus]
MSMMLCQLGQRCVMEVVVLTILSWVSVWAEEKIIFDRHAVYWNSSNPKRNTMSLWWRKEDQSMRMRDAEEREIRWKKRGKVVESGGVEKNKDEERLLLEG